MFEDNENKELTPEGGARSFPLARLLFQFL
jgi:hypothetical protein